MTLYKNVDGKRIEMSAQEEASTRAGWEANANKVKEPKPDPDIEGALRLLAVGHERQAAIEALLDRKR